MLKKFLFQKYPIYINSTGVSWYIHPLACVFLLILSLQ